MHPREFIRKWQAASLKERSAAREHFLDLCRLLGEKTPAEADPEGVWYCFERGARKTGGGDGWADVWKRGCFGWAYKGKRANRDDALPAPEHVRPGTTREATVNRAGPLRLRVGSRERFGPCC